MKPRALALALSFYFAAAFGGSAAEPQLVPLFNGKDLTNFKAEDSKAFWRVENGVLVGENDAAKKGNYLWTQKEYGDFVIEFDVRWKATSERGIDTGLEMRKPKIQLQLGVSGSLKVDKLPHYKDPVALALMRSIKQALDPQNLLNPGRVLTR